MGDSYREELEKKAKKPQARRSAAARTDLDRKRALRAEYFAKPLSRRRAIDRNKAAQVRMF